MADTIDAPATDAAYDTDFYLWTQQQAALIRRVAHDRVNAPIDWENVAEEIESLGNSDRREVESLANHILVHLLKLAASPATDPRNGWKREIRAARERVERILKDSPSLRSIFPEIVSNEWARALSGVREDFLLWGELQQAEPFLLDLQNNEPKSSYVLTPSFYPDRGEIWTRHDLRPL